MLVAVPALVWTVIAPVVAPEGTVTTSVVGLAEETLAQLFFDVSLSRDGTVSCATCHQPQRAFTDGRRVGVGIGQEPGTRNTPTLLDVASLPSLNWDGRRQCLEDQVVDPLLHPIEHGLLDETQVLDRVRATGSYAASFADAFPAGDPAITLDKLRVALASYLRTLRSGDSAFDRFQAQQDPQALTPAQRQGLALFAGRAGCAGCHRLEDGSFTDHRFYSIGVGLGSLSGRLGEIAKRAMELDEAERFRRILLDADLARLGRFLVTGRAADIGKFRTPSLRNVAVTGPYMHDGSVPSLEEAVEREVQYRSRSSGEYPVLAPEEKAALVAFLRALTDTRRVCGTYGEVESGFVETK
jgi:cytochrome c peroxidase